MKYSLIFLCLFIGFSVSAQELNLPAQYLKEQYPEMYTSIKTFSENKWEEDHQMILLEINEQSRAFIALTQNTEEKMPGVIQIFAAAKKKWTKDNDFEGLHNPTTDWTMVEMEVNEQWKAKKAY